MHDAQTGDRIRRTLVLTRLPDAVDDAELLQWVGKVSAPAKFRRTRERQGEPKVMVEYFTMTGATKALKYLSNSTRYRGVNVALANSAIPLHTTDGQLDQEGNFVPCISSRDFEASLSSREHIRGIASEMTFKNLSSVAESAKYTHRVSTSSSNDAQLIGLLPPSKRRSTASKMGVKSAADYRPVEDAKTRTVYLFAHDIPDQGCLTPYFVMLSLSIYGVILKGRYRHNAAVGNAPGSSEFYIEYLTSAAAALAVQQAPASIQQLVTYDLGVRVVKPNCSIIDESSLDARFEKYFSPCLFGLPNRLLRELALKRAPTLQPYSIDYKSLSDIVHESTSSRVNRTLSIVNVPMQDTEVTNFDLNLQLSSYGAVAKMRKQKILVNNTPSVNFLVEFGAPIGATTCLQEFTQLLQPNQRDGSVFNDWRKAGVQVVQSTVAIQDEAFDDRRGTDPRAPDYVPCRFGLLDGITLERVVDPAKDEETGEFTDLSTVLQQGEGLAGTAEVQGGASATITSSFPMGAVNNEDNEDADDAAGDAAIGDLLNDVMNASDTSGLYGGSASNADLVGMSSTPPPADPTEGEKGQSNGAQPFGGGVAASPEGGSPGTSDPAITFDFTSFGMGGSDGNQGRGNDAQRRAFDEDDDDDEDNFGVAPEDEPFVPAP